jgi:hypothetical protein
VAKLKLYVLDRKELRQQGNLKLESLVEWRWNVKVLKLDIERILPEARCQQLIGQIKLNGKKGDNMGLPTTDGRKLWLDESQLHANNFLTTMLDVEKKRTLSKAERNLKQMSASFLYLYEKAVEIGLLDEEDDLVTFFNETIHW